MTIQVDSREHNHAIQKILAEFENQGVKWFISKLYVGDYMSLTNPTLIIDRKKDLDEIGQNITREHERFVRELERARENGIKVIVLCEHGHGIKTLADVFWWRNPREYERVKVNGKWTEVHKNVLHGDKIAKILKTMTEEYGFEVMFCDKKETGKRIIELLKGEKDNVGSESANSTAN